MVLIDGREGKVGGTVGGECMTTAEFDAIQEALINKMSIKKDLALQAAQKEIDTIQREYDAYFDGVDDALKAVRDAMKER